MLFKVRERYQVRNNDSEDNKRFLTIIMIKDSLVFYKFDGYNDVYSFEIDSIFALNLIKVN